MTYLESKHIFRRAGERGAWLSTLGSFLKEDEGRRTHDIGHIFPLKQELELWAWWTKECDFFSDFFSEPLKYSFSDFAPIFPDTLFHHNGWVYGCMGVWVCDVGDYGLKLKSQRENVSEREIFVPNSKNNESICFAKHKNMSK